MIPKAEIFDLLIKVVQRAESDARSPDDLKLLLDRGLIKYWQGKALLTEKGRQFIFQRECEQVLRIILKEHRPPKSEEVLQWLVKHHFIVKGEQLCAGWQVTPRGRDWLSQLD